MAVGICAHNLRKVYLSPPPPAAGSAMTNGSSKQERKKNHEIAGLDGVSLDINPAEIFGLLGPNGAGKSTLVGILTTRIRPTSGQALIGAFDVWKESVAVRRLIGVVQQKPNLDFSLTAREILHFHAAYFGAGPGKRAALAKKLLDRLQLTDRADQLVHGFSGGMMQRLVIARAMMHDPQVLFLDEPSNGLDPQTRLLLWEIVRDYQASGKTILLTTHNMEEADALCHRIAIVDHGKVIALGTPKELKASIPGGYLLRVRFSRSPAEKLTSYLQSLRGVRKVVLNDNTADVYADNGGPLVVAVVSAASEQCADICDVHISEPSLENLFLHHTGRSLRQ